MKMFVDNIHNFLTDGLNQAPFSDKFDVRGANIGKYDESKARPVVGGHWTAMALHGVF